MYQVDVEGKRLVPLTPTRFSDMHLSERYDIQEWIAHHPNILGEDLLVIAKELVLPSGIRLDLLTVDREGALVVIELKRDDSGSSVEWQAIKYASYCSSLLEDEVIEYSAEYMDCTPEEARIRLESFIGPESNGLNERQRIILCSREFHSDVASAALWLREQGVDITCVKLEPYRDERGVLFLSLDTIIPLREAKDYVVRKEKQEKQSRVRGDWSPYFYVNVGESPHRNWDDCREYGFLSAGHGRKWSKQLERLEPGDRIFAYLKKHGYVGFGEVVSPAVPVKDFASPVTKRSLLNATLVEPGLLTHKNDSELTEYLVGVQWFKTLPREMAIYESGFFSHPSVVARMRAGATVAKLENEFVNPPTDSDSAP